MYWTCEHCGTENGNNYDYCSTCEYAGCTPGDHKCNDNDDNNSIEQTK